MEKNYCYLPGEGGDKKLLQQAQRERERERETERETERQSERESGV